MRQPFSQAINQILVSCVSPQYVWDALSTLQAPMTRSRRGGRATTAARPPPSTRARRGVRQNIDMPPPCKIEPPPPPSPRLPATTGVPPRFLPVTLHTNDSESGTEYCGLGLHGYVLFLKSSVGLRRIKGEDGERSSNSDHSQRCAGVVIVMIQYSDLKCTFQDHGLVPRDEKGSNLLKVHVMYEEKRSCMRHQHDNPAYKQESYTISQETAEFSADWPKQVCPGNQLAAPQTGHPLICCEMRYL